MESARSKNHKIGWPQFVLCLENKGNEVSLEVGKIYRRIKPHPNDFGDWIRVIDESGEDYLFPSDRFVAVELPAQAKKKLASVSAS